MHVNRRPRFTSDQIGSIFSDVVHSDHNGGQVGLRNKNVVLNQESSEKLALILAITMLPNLKITKTYKDDKEIRLILRSLDTRLVERIQAVFLWFKHVLSDKNANAVGRSILDATLPETIHDLSHMVIIPTLHTRCPEPPNFFNSKKSREIDYIRMIMPILYSETATLLEDIWKKMLDSLEASSKASSLLEENKIEVLVDAKSSEPRIVELPISTAQLKTPPIKPIKPKKTEPKLTTSLMMQRGTAFYDQNNHVEALKCFRQVIDSNPEHVDAWYHKGLAEHKLAQYPEALASYSQATRLHPMFVNGLLGKARIQSYLGQSLEALASYSQIITIESQHQEALHEREQLLQQINISAIQDSQRDVFERAKQSLERLMQQHEEILTSRLDANLEHYLRLQQAVLIEHNTLTAQGVNALVEKIVRAHSTVGTNPEGLRHDVLTVLTELANLKYQLAMQCNKALTQEQILNKLNVAFGEEAEQRVRFQSFKEDLKSHPAWAVFFIEFVIGFSSKIESARLLQSGYFDLAASRVEQGVGVIGSLASGLPGIGGLASISAKGTAMVINMYRQGEIAKGVRHIDIVTTDVACLSQELCRLIISHFHESIDSVYKVKNVSQVGKLSLGLFSVSDEEVRLKMGQKLVREAAKKAVDCLVDYLQSSELTSGPIANQLLTVIGCHIEKIFGTQHLVSKTDNRTTEVLSPASTKQIAENTRAVQALNARMELIQKQLLFSRGQRESNNTDHKPAAEARRFGGATFS